MNDSDDSASDLSETILAAFDGDQLPNLAAEVVEDLAAGNESDDLSDEVSLASLSLMEGPPAIKPRPYQIEMVEGSLKQNIIVAVLVHIQLTLHHESDQMNDRWTQDLGRLMCEWSYEASSQSLYLTGAFSFIFRPVWASNNKHG